MFFILIEYYLIFFLTGFLNLLSFNCFYPYYPSTSFGSLIFYNRLVRIIIGMLCSIQIRPWIFNHVEKHISMIDSYWTQSQSETPFLIGTFQSGDQNDLKVRNKFVRNFLIWAVECSILFTDSSFKPQWVMKRNKSEMCTWKCGCVVSHHPNRKELCTMGDNNKQEQMVTWNDKMIEEQNKMKRCTLLSYRVRAI